MAVINRESAFCGFAGPCATVELEAYPKVIDVVYSPPGALEREFKAAAVFSVEENALIERERCGEDPEARGANRVNDQACGDALAVEKVGTEERLSLSGCTGSRGKHVIAECSGREVHRASRLALCGLECRAHETPDMKRGKDQQKE
jgi:hypothetical protein